MLTTTGNATIFLEVLLRKRRFENGYRHSQIRQEVTTFLRDNYAALRLNWTIYPSNEEDSQALAEKVERISVAQVVGMGYNADIVPITDGCVFEMYIYHLEDGDEFAVHSSVQQLCVGEDGTVSAVVWNLPGKIFDGLWESLIFEDDIKQRLLRYMNTVMLFSNRKVDPKIVSFNR